ncbi:Methyl-CpG-binding domain protein 5 [Ancistrocladus abbreviatus]
MSAAADDEEPDSLEHLPPDPLLKPGAFIDPTTNGYPQDPPGFPKPLRSTAPSTPIHNPDYSDTEAPEPGTVAPEPGPASASASASEVTPPRKRNKRGGSEPPSEPSASEMSETFDWLPPGWRVEFRVRSSGASAGARDKYYMDPVSNRRFRSKKEVLYFLEYGHAKKKTLNSDGDTLEKNSSSGQKRKTSVPKAAVSMENFKFDDVPEKVKWELTDVYAGSWRPLLGSVERVPETDKQEWAAAFAYLCLQKGDKPA